MERRWPGTLVIGTPLVDSYLKRKTMGNHGKPMGNPWKSHGKPMENLCFLRKMIYSWWVFHIFLYVWRIVTHKSPICSWKKCGRITIVIIPPVMWKKSVLRVMKNGEHNQEWGINESCMLFENKGKCHIPTSLSFSGPLSSQLPWASQLIRLSQVLVPDFAERVSVSQGHPGERSVCCLEPI